MSAPTTPAEIVAVSHRFTALTWFRVFMAGVAASVALAAPSVRYQPGGRVAIVALVYAVGSVLVELTRRRVRERPLALVSIPILVDAVFVLYVLRATGGSHSPLLFLMYLDIMAVTLLVSFRTGVQTAVWYALLILLARAGAAAGFLGTWSGREDGAVATALMVTGCLCFAAGAAGFASLNERALRSGGAALAGLVALGNDLERGPLVDDVLLSLDDQITERLGFPRVAIFVDLDDEHGRCLANPGTGPVLFDARAGVGQELREDGLTKTQVRAALDAVGESEISQLLPEAKDVVLVPLVADGRCLGLVAAEWAHHRGLAVNPQTVHVLEESVSHAALALRNALLLAEVRRLATRDPLTGLANRRFFEEALTHALGTAERSHGSVALAMLDLDGFKEVNDTQGHQMGDAMLEQLGKVLQETCRKSDLPARIGGDEFIVLMPGADGLQAVAAAERIRREIGARIRAAPATVSVGVAVVPDNASTSRDLLSAADEALYEAKAAGRNCVRRSEVSRSERVRTPEALEKLLGSQHSGPRRT